MQLTWTTKATENLEEITEYIAAANPVAASKLEQTITHIFTG